MHVFVDQVQCTGSGVCEMLAPLVFVLDEEGLATVLESGTTLADGGAPTGTLVPAGQEALVQDASAACPGGCIHVVEN